MDEFMTPPKHIHFLAKKLFGENGQILDGSIAYIGVNGGGPDTPHTHPHDHLFIVTAGEAKILLADQTILVKQNESYLVKGSFPHSVWNNTEQELVMIGMNVK